MKNHLKASKAKADPAESPALMIDSNGTSPVDPVDLVDPRDLLVVSGMDLLAFCEPLDEYYTSGDYDTRKYAIDKPWVHEGWLYATNTRILVAFRRPALPDTPPPIVSRNPQRYKKEIPILYPDAMAVLRPALSIHFSAWKAWPAVNLIETKGQRNSNHPCPECGQGLFVQNVFGRHVDHQYDKLIREFSNVSGSSKTASGKGWDKAGNFLGEKEDPIYLRFGDPHFNGHAYGVVMPICQE